MTCSPRRHTSFRFSMFVLAKFPAFTVRLTLLPAVVTLLAICTAFPPIAAAQPLAIRKIANGVWFVPGGGHGYCNNIVIEMKDYLIVVDANYPGRARELVSAVHRLSPKPVLFVFDTHAHRDHSYGNIVWTEAGAVTFAWQGVVEEMDRYEPARWRATAAERPDVASLHLDDAPRPELTFRKSPFILKDSMREVRFYFLGWAHTRGDGFVWLPRERILCTGDAAINARPSQATPVAPHNKLWDANLGNWPTVLTKAEGLNPRIILPGHGDPGGLEILAGQKNFLIDLVAAVRRQVQAGVPLAKMDTKLPERDRDWAPSDLATDFSIAYAEITQHAPAGALPHVWK